MTKSLYAVRYAPIADAQIEAALLWWEDNRPANLDLLAKELDRTFDALAIAPHIGRRVRLRGHTNIRRLLLRLTGYHIHYQVVESEREVWIVYFRHARRRPLRAR